MVLVSPGLVGGYMVIWGEKRGIIPNRMVPWINSGYTDPFREGCLHRPECLVLASQGLALPVIATSSVVSPASVSVSLPGTMKRCVPPSSQPGGLTTGYVFLSVCTITVLSVSKGRLVRGAIPA